MCKEGTFGTSLDVVVVLFVPAVYTWSTHSDRSCRWWLVRVEPTPNCSPCQNTDARLRPVSKCGHLNNVHRPLRLRLSIAQIVSPIPFVVVSLRFHDRPLAWIWNAARPPPFGTVPVPRVPFLPLRVVPVFFGVPPPRPWPLRWLLGPVFVSFPLLFFWSRCLVFLVVFSVRIPPDFVCIRLPFVWRLWRCQWLLVPRQNRSQRVGWWAMLGVGVVGCCWARRGAVP